MRKCMFSFSNLEAVEVILVQNPNLNAPKLFYTTIENLQIGSYQKSCIIGKAIATNEDDENQSRNE